MSEAAWQEAMRAAMRKLPLSAGAGAGAEAPEAVAPSIALMNV